MWFCKRDIMQIFVVALFFWNQETDIVIMWHVYFQMYGNMPFPSCCKCILKDNDVFLNFLK